LKIAVISTTLYRHQGADRVMWQLADDLSKKGNAVTLFVFQGNWGPPPDVKLVTIGMPAGFIGQRLFHLTFFLNVITGIKYGRLLREFDVIYTGPYPASWLGYVAKKWYGETYVYYFFHFNLPGFIPGLLARVYSRIHIFLEKWTLRRANKVITISHFSKDSLANLFDKDIEVIYCSVDCDRFKPGLDRTRIRSKYRITDQRVILCVGQLIPSKGMHLLIEAFHSIKDKIPDARLIIVGKAVFPGYLKKLRDMAGDSVIFVEDASDDDMPDYYAACDVYATATLWEGFNIPLIEAQACGKPVVAFKTGPHPEVVDDGITGMLIPPANIPAFSSAITKLLQDQELKDRLGNQGVNMVRKRFCLKDMH